MDVGTSTITGSMITSGNPALVTRLSPFVERADIKRTADDDPSKLDRGHKAGHIDGRPQRGADDQEHARVIDEVSKLAKPVERKGANDVLDAPRADEQPGREARPSRRLVRRAAGPPRRTIGDLMRDPQVVRIASMGQHSLEQVATYKRQMLDALMEVDQARRAGASPEQLRPLRDAFNERNKLWLKVKDGRPLETPVIQGSGRPSGTRRSGRPAGSSKDLDSLMSDPEVVKTAALGHYSLEEVATFKRQLLDAQNEYERTERQLPPGSAEVRALQKTYNERNTIWRRVKEGLSPHAEPRGRRGSKPGSNRKDISSLMSDPEVVRIAAMGKHSVEEVATVKRQLLDAQNALDRAKRQRVAPTPDELRPIQDVVNAHSQAWRAIKRGLPPLTTLNIRGQKPKKMTDLAKDADVIAAAEIQGLPVTDVANIKRRYLDARQELRDANAKLAEAQTQQDLEALPDMEKRLTEARGLFNQHSREWTNLQKPLGPGAGRYRKTLAELMTDRDVVEAARRSGRPVEEVATIKRQFYNARLSVRDLKNWLKEVEATGDLETQRDVEKQLRAAKDEFNIQQWEWNHVRNEAKPPRGRRRRGLNDLLKDPEVIDVARRTQRTVDDVAAARLRHIDARYEVDILERKLKEAQKGEMVEEVKILKEQLRQARDEFNKQQRAWRALRSGRDRPGPPRTRPQVAPQPPPNPAPVNTHAEALQRVYDASDGGRLAQQKTDKLSTDVQNARTRLEQVQARLRLAEEEVERCKAEVECQRRDLEGYEEALGKAQQEVHTAENRVFQAAQHLAKHRPPVRTSEDPQSSLDASESTEANQDEVSRWMHCDYRV